MTRFIRLAWLLPLAVGCGQSSPVATTVEQAPTAQEAAVAATPASFNVEGVPTVAFSVPDMMCEFSCVPTVRDALAKQPGVKEVKVELETKTATVAVDKDQFDPDAAIAALVDLQFTNTTLASEAQPEAAPAAGADAHSTSAPADAAENKAKS
ncbi:MAG: heavy-metal-associated domain-containing protein [Pirellulales bacterium]|nr:heavy-metal-associated domain-containing protein [Pirellulales bacterium]